MSTKFLKQKWDSLCDNTVRNYGSGDHLERIFSMAWETIVEKYSEPHRYYHTLAHLESLYFHAQKYGYAELSIIESFDTVTLEFALFFHDIVYDTSPPLSAKNEKLSFDLFKEYFGPHLPPDLVSTVGVFIMATKSHHSAESREDLNFFLDLDLSILGAEREAYKQYAMQIRKEYESIPADIYCRERAKILRKISESDIYRFPQIKDQIEGLAHANIEWECNILEAGRLVDIND